MKQIVISVPDEWLEGTPPNLYDVMGAVMNGTVLPEHYGRLIDQEVFLKKLDEYWSQRKGLSYMDIETVACLMTPTVIPARR